MDPKSSRSSLRFLSVNGTAAILLLDLRPAGPRLGLCATRPTGFEPVTFGSVDRRSEAYIWLHRANLSGLVAKKSPKSRVRGILGAASSCRHARSRPESGRELGRRTDDRVSSRAGASGGHTRRPHPDEQQRVPCGVLRGGKFSPTTQRHPGRQLPHRRRRAREAVATAPRRGRSLRPLRGPVRPGRTAFRFQDRRLCGPR